MAVLSSDVSSVYGVVMDRGSLVDFLEGLFAYFRSCGGQVSGGQWCWWLLVGKEGWRGMEREIKNVSEGGSVHVGSRTGA